MTVAGQGTTPQPVVVAVGLYIPTYNPFPHGSSIQSPGQIY